MKSRTKLWIVIGLLLINIIIIGVAFGNLNNFLQLLVSLLMILGAGCGWYARCTKLEEAGVK